MMTRRQAIAVLASAASPAPAVHNWISLFDGVTLANWKANLPSFWCVEADAERAVDRRAHLFSA